MKITEPKLEMFHDHFQNFRRYSIPKAQLIAIGVCTHTAMQCVKAYSIGGNKWDAFFAIVFAWFTFLAIRRAVRK